MVPKSNVVYNITYNNVYDNVSDVVSNVISDVVSNVGIFNRVNKWHIIIFIPCAYIEAYNKLVIYLEFTRMQIKLIQSTSKCREQRKKMFF